jgi:ubiquinone/menaquinone biosynthesis C-methylase UbiE
VRLDDPEVVRREYARPERLAARKAAHASAEGPNARDLVVRLVAEAEPARLLEVGCGAGELAERLAAEVGCEVVAVDLSPEMVALACARGVDAQVADVEELPFADGEFDCVVAAWMLYHVPDLERGLDEVARVLRPGGRFVAVTLGGRHLAELWELVGGLRTYELPFARENGAALLARRFRSVEQLDVRATVTFADNAAVESYISASITRAHLAGRLPRVDGPLKATTDVAIFTAER